MKLTVSIVIFRTSFTFTHTTTELTAHFFGIMQQPVTNGRAMLIYRWFAEKSNSIFNIRHWNKEWKKEKLNKWKSVYNATWRCSAGVEYRNFVNGAHFHAWFERNNFHRKHPKDGKRKCYCSQNTQRYERVTIVIRISLPIFENLENIFINSEYEFFKLDKTRKRSSRKRERKKKRLWQSFQPVFAHFILSVLKEIKCRIS